MLGTVQRERDIFERKLTVVTAVREFMGSLLQTTEADSFPDQNITFRGVLDKADLLLHYAPPADAETRAQVALELARINLLLGRYSQAAQQISASQKALAPSTEQFKRMRFEAALLAMQLQALQKITPETEVLAHRLRQELMVEFGASDPLAYLASGLLGDILYAQGKTKEASILYREVLTAPITHLDSSVRTTAFTHLAETLMAKGDSNDALKLLNSQQVLLEKHYGDHHPATLSALYQLAITEQARGEVGAALDLYNRVAVGRGKVLGATHVDTVAALKKQAALLIQTGQYNQAETLLSSLLTTLEQSQTPVYSFTPTLVNLLVDALEHQEKFTAAENILQRAIANQSETQSASPEAFDIRHRFALLLMKKGDLAEAENIFLETLDAVSEKFGTDHPLIWSIGNSYGECLLRLKRLQQAEMLLLRTHEGLKKLYGPNHDLLVKARARLADLYTASNQTERADKWKRPPPNLPRSESGKKTD